MAAALRKRVLMLIPNLGMGGAQRVFHDHSVEFAKHYDVTEAVFNLDGGNLFPSGNEVVDLSVDGGGSSLDKARNFSRRVSRLAELKRTQQPAVCISHLEGADYVNVLSHQQERLVLCVHGSKMHDQNISGVMGWVRRRLLIPRLYRRAHRIVTVSQGIRQELIEELGLPAAKVAVINNFFDLPLLARRAQEPVPAPYAEVLATYPVVVTAGRFAPEKNLLALLDIMQLVHQQEPRTKLLLIGHGPQAEELEARCRALGLTYHLPGQPPEALAQATVVFAGFQANPHAFFSRSTVFVLPSRNEGFPMALGEAMACGVPVAAADCPTGPREILAPASRVPVGTIREAEWTSYGVLLPLLNQPAAYAADIRQWAEAVVALLGNPARRTQLAAQARQRMEDFSQPKIFRQWIELIEDVINRA